ncbi:MAG: hypothetical protein LBD99_00425 [Candidatus Margulisbacteria bacterium]|jgi:hypothetical protein|nr:hypothetical protein [Candidatus Margulisiibacteriota bacterium]
MKKYLWLCGLLLVLGAADNNAADFLQTGLSARSMALGSTGIAAGGHIDAAFLNPAALQDVRLEFFSAAAQDFGLAENKMFAWAGAFTFQGRPVAAGLIYAGSAVNGLERTELDADERPVEQGVFNVGKNNYTLVLAGEQAPDFWWGWSLRRYLYALDASSAEATALDLGCRWTMLRLGGAEIFGGTSLRNIGRTKVRWSTGHTDTLPFGVNFGLSAAREILAGQALLNLDWGWREEQELEFRAGLEYDLHTLILRAGWDERLTYGIGLHYFELTLDYAQTTHEDLGLQQRVSLLLYL